MKKSIIALAVAGAITAPMIAQADATLYGRIHERVVFQEDKDVNVANAEARLGVKGNSVTDSGLTAFYQLEIALKGDSAKGQAFSSSRQESNQQVRQMNAGLKGDFGKVTVGRFTNPLTSTYAGDIFEGESGPYQLATYRIGKAISYATPSFNGFSATGTIIGDGGNSDVTDRDVDSYVVTLSGAFGPVSATLAYQDIDALEANSTTDTTEKEIG
ncbi:MAG: putative porin, partial [Oceanospirillaceae bacterium]